MILAAVDDLMFASKIRAAAGPLGVEVAFARSPADVLDLARTGQPALVLVDLNSRRLDPIATVAALKADAACRDIRTIGFVSHVQTDTIRAARAAGVDEVMARSAFSRNLAEILTSAGAARDADRP